MKDLLLCVCHVYDVEEEEEEGRKNDDTRIWIAVQVQVKVCWSTHTRCATQTPTRLDCLAAEKCSTVPAHRKFGSAIEKTVATHQESAEDEGHNYCSMKRP